MKYLKLFNESNIERRDFPFKGHNLSPREKKILTDLVDEDYLDRFIIKVEDFRYYICDDLYHHNVFGSLFWLKDYILYCYYITTDNSKELLKLIETSKLDSSFDDNNLIVWACHKGYIEIVRLLLDDPRVVIKITYDPIWFASRSGHKEIVKLLLNDQRVRDKLTDEQINKHTNEIS